MKKVLSILAAFLTVTLLSAGAQAEGNITEIRSDVGGAAGDVIERAAYGGIIHVMGTGFRNTQGDRFVRMEFSSPEVFHKDLTVLSWSRTDIKVQIPSMESFPASCHSISVTGNLMVMDSDGPFSDSVSFTVAPLISGVREAVPTLTREEPPREMVPGTGSEEEEEAEVVFSPAPLTAQPFKRPERYEMAPMPYEAYTFPSRNRVEVEVRQPSLTFYLPPVIDSVLPAIIFSPGELITVEGRNFLERDDIRKLIIYFEPPVVTEPFYMDLIVKSWEPERIVAVVAGWDSDRFWRDPYEKMDFLPQALKDYGSANTVGGMLRIMKMPDIPISADFPVGIEPFTGMPEITYTANKVARGGETWLYGIGFAEFHETTSKAYAVKNRPWYSLSKSSAVMLNIIEWQSAAIRVGIPPELETGVYSIYIVNGAGRESNRIQVDVKDIVLERRKIETAPARIP